MLFDKSINGFADQFASPPAYVAGESGKLVSLPTGQVYLCSNHLGAPMSTIRVMHPLDGFTAVAQVISSSD